MSIENIKNSLIQNSKQDTTWLEKANWRQENEAWLDVSFKIAVKILSALKENKKAGTSPKNQKELAAVMDCTPQYVNKLLKGAENLTIETISRLEVALGVRLIEVAKSTVVEVKEELPYLTINIGKTSISNSYSEMFNDISFEPTLMAAEPLSFYKITLRKGEMDTYKNEKSYNLQVA